MIFTRYCALWPARLGHVSFGLIPSAPWQLAQDAARRQGCQRVDAERGRDTLHGVQDTSHRLGVAGPCAVLHLQGPLVQIVDEALQHAQQALALGLSGPAIGQRVHEARALALQRALEAPARDPT